MEINVRILTAANILAFAFMANLTSAQVRFGPKIGLNFSELPKSTEFIIGKQHFYNGFHVGGITEFKISGHLYLQPGLMLTNKGSKYNVGNIASPGTTGYSNFQFSCYYTDLQLNLKYNFDFGSFKTFIIAGPQAGMGLKGKWEATYKTSSKVHFGNEPADDFKPFEYGINIGAGFETGRIQLSTQYYMGLMSLSTSIPQMEEEKYKILSISFSYLFGNENVYKDFESKYLSKHRNPKKTGKKRF